jgi:hypothetical protein
MPYSEIIAVCSQIHTKHINTLCGQNVVFVNVKLVVRIVTTKSRGLNKEIKGYMYTHSQQKIFHKCENLIQIRRIL